MNSGLDGFPQTLYGSGRDRWWRVICKRIEISLEFSYFTRGHLASVSHWTIYVLPYFRVNQENKDRVHGALQSSTGLHEMNRIRTKVVQELITTEQDFVQHLRDIVEVKSAQSLVLSRDITFVLYSTQWRYVRNYLCYTFNGCHLKQSRLNVDSVRHRTRLHFCYASWPPNLFNALL